MVPVLQVQLEIDSVVDGPSLQDVLSLYSEAVSKLVHNIFIIFGPVDGLRD